MCADALLWHVSHVLLAKCSNYLPLNFFIQLLQHPQIVHLVLVVQTPSEQSFSYNKITKIRWILVMFSSILLVTGCPVISSSLTCSLLSKNHLYTAVFFMAFLPYTYTYIAYIFFYPYPLPPEIWCLFIPLIPVQTILQCTCTYIHRHKQQCMPFSINPLCFSANAAVRQLKTKVMKLTLCCSWH